MEINILKFVEFTGENSIQFYWRGLGYLVLKDQSPCTDEWGMGGGVDDNFWGGQEHLVFSGNKRGLGLPTE